MREVEYGTGVVPAPDGILFPFLCANDLRLSLLNIRARSFLLSCTYGVHTQG